MNSRCTLPYTHYRASTQFFPNRLNLTIIPLLYLLIYKVAIRRQSQLPLQWYHVCPQVEAFISLELRPLDQQILKFQRWEAKILIVDH